MSLFSARINCLKCQNSSGINLPMLIAIFLIFLFLGTVVGKIIIDQKIINKPSSEITQDEKDTMDKLAEKVRYNKMPL